MTHIVQQKKLYSAGCRLASFCALCLAINLPSIAQTTDDDLPLLDLDSPIRMNFSGNWEKDFARSDNWEDELTRRMPVSYTHLTLPTKA